MAALITLARLLTPALLLAVGASPAAARQDDPFGLLPPVAAAPCAETGQAALGLAEVVESALCRNPQTREVWANARFQAAQVGVAQAAYLPGVNATLSAGRERTNLAASDSPANRASVELALSYLLYDFGARAAALENARQLFAAAVASRDSMVQAVFHGAVQAYYQVQAARAALQAAIQSERANEESFRAAQARYGVGGATPADQLQARTAYSQASLVRIQAEGALRVAEGGLAAFIGRDADQAVPLAPAATLAPASAGEQDVTGLIALARQRRPDLRAAEARVQAARAGAAAAVAGGKPSLSLGVSGANSQSGGDASVNSAFLGLTLSVPIFSGYATTYRVRAAEAQVEASTAQRDRLDLQVALDVWNAHHNLLTSAQSLRSSADLLASAEQSERVALGRYKAGVGSILDVLTAQSALAGARQQRVQAEFNWNLARATLALAVGNLDLGLLQGPSGAGAPATDPSGNKS